MEEHEVTPSPDTIPVMQLVDHPVSSPAIPSNDSTPTVDSLEERYNKLKAITLKYKKKLAEQTTELERLRERPGLQNASKIQQQYDKALDEVERLKKLESTLQKDLQKTVEENIELKIKESESTSQIQSLSSSHKILRDKLDLFEKDAECTDELKSKVENLEKELQEAKDDRADAQQEKRQLQILSLEVTDYELKLQDASGHLEAKKVECDKLLTELSNRDQKVKELESIILNYKESENKLILVKDSLQADSVRKAEKITFLQDEVGKLNDRWNEKKIEFDKLHQEFETAKSTFVLQDKDTTEKLNNSQKSIAHLEQKISLLEENKRSRETQITNLKLEMRQLESELRNYKAKAQAMLKSHKPTTLIDNHEEMEKLQKVIQEFHSEVAILKVELQKQKLENENLLSERAELNIQLSELKADSIKKDIQLNAEFQNLKQDLRDKDDHLKRQLEENNAESERIKSSFKIEIETMKIGYENQVQLLREQYELLKSENENASTSATVNFESLERILEGSTSFHSMPRQYTNSSLPTPPPPSDHASTQMGFNRISNPLTIDTSDTNGISFDQLRMIPRGEGEGSESVTSVSAYTPKMMDNYNVTFEQLLSSSFESSKGNDGDHDRTMRDSLHKELVRCQSQVSHLTSLLRESESNCDRLAQLSDALKEEIRRIERDKERQEHLKENTEYLKNVLLKFITLTGEAERKRLIPVLKTMLKLTTEEVDKLEGIVNGGREAREGGAGNGWSSYLPLWSGGGSGG